MEATEFQKGIILALSKEGNIIHLFKETNRVFFTSTIDRITMPAFLILKGRGLIGEVPNPTEVKSTTYGLTELGKSFITK